MASHQVPYGAWVSPITAAMIAGASIRLQDMQTDGADVYWAESRPAEQGRYALVKCASDGAIADVPGSATFSARSLVCSYGGGAFAMEAGTLYFVNYVNGVADSDQRLYRLPPGGTALPLTPETQGKICYGDILVDSKRGRLIAVQQDSGTLNKSGQPTISLIAVDSTSGGQPKVLQQGNDFYTSPCISPDGSKLAWLTWNYPHMPWDVSEVWAADIAADGSLTSARKVAGDGAESIFQPQWSPDGTLYFVSDKDDWWNLCRWDGMTLTQVTHEKAELGEPQWNLGTSNYTFLSAQEIVCGVCTAGVWKLSRVDTTNGAVSDISSEWTDISYIRSAGASVVCFAGSPIQLKSVVRIDAATGKSQVLRSSGDVSVAVSPYLSMPVAISFPTTDSATSHAFYYPPKNPDFTASSDEKPPLIIFSHGGPTAATTTLLNLQIQYFTSRGLGVVDVNYRGSTGYGRHYRLTLYKEWGIMDVADCANAARYLVMRGLADDSRLAARGGSAGGYVTLCLATFTDILAAGASYYGISDLLGLVQNTDNFEFHYVDVLIGPLPQCTDVYKARSSLYNANRVKCPVIFFQGADDPVVPPEQTLSMVSVLKQNRVPTDYLLFPNEQHGFRIAADIVASLQAELAFYGLFLFFTPVP